MTEFTTNCPITNEPCPHLVEIAPLFEQPSPEASANLSMDTYNTLRPDLNSIKFNAHRASLITRAVNLPCLGETPDGNCPAAEASYSKHQQRNLKGIFGVIGAHFTRT